MLRVLLAIEDYGELLFVQTLLKKLGFDVDGIQNDRQFEESFLALNPEIVVATAQGKKVDGLAMAESIRRVRGLPKVILLASGPMLDRLRSLEAASYDAVLETPISTSRFLGLLAKLSETDAAVLLDKYRKLKATLSPERESDLQILRRDADGEWDMLKEASITATPFNSPADSDAGMEARRDRFSQALKTLEKPTAEKFERQRIQKFTKEIRAGEDLKKTAALEIERQAFVKAMFKKARGS